MATKTDNPADYIVPLNINGLSGRMLRMPPPEHSTHEFLLVYGHHALLERWWGLAQNFNDYGAVTMPDLPGFGGMDSFSKIKRKPTIDNFADYLAAFVKLRFKQRRITIVAISFGFVVATRMLQRYPELAKKVDLIISLVGFMHRNDFQFKPLQRSVYRRMTWLFSKRPVSYLIRYGGLNSLVITQLYVRLPVGKRRFLEMEPTDFKSMMQLEVRLWQVNDVRTHWATTTEFLSLDNCKIAVNVPVWHVASQNDYYFNNYTVSQHMQVVFKDFHQSIMQTTAHTPSIMADKEGLGIMVPPDLRRHLRKSNITSD